jgi:hypothetical protein
MIGRQFDGFRPFCYSSGPIWRDINWSEMTVMRALTLFLVLLCAAGAADLGHYRMQVRLDPVAGELRVDSEFGFPVDAGAERVKFALNKGLQVTSASCDECSGYSFETSQPAGIMFVKNAVPLEFVFRRRLPEKKNIHFKVRYEGKVLPSGENSMQAGWVELALYSAWFPVGTGLGRFTYDMNVTVDPKYKVTGSGDIKMHEPGAYEIHQTADTFDIVLMASPHIQSRKVGESLRLDSVGLNQDEAARIASASALIMERLGQWFGPSSSSRLTVVFTPREGGGGYSRPGMVCYSRWTLSSGDRLLRGLAHEMGHLWWIGAPVETWEDWLNEGFAEYTALMIVRDQLGEAAFQKEIQALEKQVQGAPPVWGISRSDNRAYTVLYEKGALILCRLEKQIGKEAFARYLKDLAGDKVRSVNEALTLLAKTNSPDASAALERMLRE